jgi:glutathione S-transferase
LALSTEPRAPSKGSPASPSEIANSRARRPQKQLGARCQGYPDSGNVKAGAKAIKFHIDYIGWLLDQRRWLAGDAMTLADFAAAAHLSALDYISDVDWNRNANVKDWYAKIKSRPAFRSLLADHVPGFPAPPHYSDLDF